MHVERHQVDLTTDGAGAATGYTPVVTGAVRSVRYVKTDFTDGVDFAVTSEATGETIWAQDNVNASTTVHPRASVHGTDGTAALFAAGGTALRDHIVVARDRIKIVASNGGATKTGTFHVTIS